MLERTFEGYGFSGVKLGVTRGCVPKRDLDHPVGLARPGLEPDAAHQGMLARQRGGGGI
jgi:hypothetical protein